MDIVIATIHKPASGLNKGLGHIGGTLQRLASFILEINNSTDGEGFIVRHIKSRISAKTKKELLFTKDRSGNIDLNVSPVIMNGKEKSEDSEFNTQ